jgi:hypothetical protein
LLDTLAPSGGYALSFLHVRRRKFFTHRRGFSRAAGGCGMNGLDTPAPSGVIDNRPGGIGGHPTEFTSCTPPGAA